METAPEGRQIDVSLSRAFWCVFYASGVIASLIVYGLLQERIMQISYDGALFTHALFLVFLSRLGAVVFALCMARATGESTGNIAPLWKYGVISFSNVYASACQYEALKYVSFPVQMLGKSFKMMPVMIWGMAINGKSYKLQDWLVAMAVTGGVTGFLLAGPTASASSHGSSFPGLLLLLAFLALDGATSTMQEKLFKEEKTTKYNQMMYVNGISAMTSLVTLIATGSLSPALSFFLSHRAFVRDAMVFNASAIAGQWFIISQVKEFGALVYAATMNVRQVTSIVVSYAAYHHSITALQALALFCVFAALFWKSCAGLWSERSAEKTPLVEAKDPEAALGCMKSSAKA